VQQPRRTAQGKRQQSVCEGFAFEYAGEVARIGRKRRMGVWDEGFDMSTDKKCKDVLNDERTKGYSKIF
jgi:hypothetical protein